MKSINVISLGTLYASFVVSVYLAFKFFAQGGTTFQLSSSALVLSVLLVLIKPNLLRFNHYPKGLWLRGFLFAGAQFLLLLDIQNGKVGTSLASATLGILCLSLLHQMKIKKLTLSEILTPAFLLTIGGVLLTVMTLGITFFSFLSGLFQGASFFLLFEHSKIKNSFLQILFPLVFILSLLGPFLDQPYVQTFQGTHFFTTMVLGLCILLIQLFAYKINLKINRKDNSFVSGIRIPIGLMADHLFLSTALSPMLILGSAFFTTGISMHLILNLKSKGQSE